MITKIYSIWRKKRMASCRSPVLRTKLKSLPKDSERKPSKDTDWKNRYLTCKHRKKRKSSEIVKKTKRVKKERARRRSMSVEACLPQCGSKRQVVSTEEESSRLEMKRYAE